MIQRKTLSLQRPAKEEAIAALQTILTWIGEDPDRSGLLETPERVLKSYEEFFSGYKQDPHQILSKTFEEVNGYGDIILLKDIDIFSHCEHHLVPFTGKAHIAYIPNKRIVGLSKLARLADCYARRLQLQERLTVQIANALYEAIQPKGVAVLIEAKHNCLATRGARHLSSRMVTRKFLGVMQTDKDLQKQFLDMV